MTEKEYLKSHLSDHSQRQVALCAYAIIVAAVLCSCQNKVDTSSQTERQIGKYIYQDDNDIYHIDANCHRLKYGKDRYDHSIYAMHPCDTATFVFHDSERVCSNCVSLSAFENLKVISDRNKRFDVYRHWIYNKLIEANYDMESYEDFVGHLTDPKRRKRLYDAALKEGWDIGSFDEFSNSLGFNNHKHDG